MKKMLAVTLAILTVAQTTHAAILEVINGFTSPARKIAVVVKGSDNNYNNMNAQILNPGQKGVFGGTGGMSGPVRFAFVDEMMKNGVPVAEYNVFETFMSNDNDPEFKTLKGSERDTFTRNKACGYGKGYNDQTFPLWAADFKTITLRPDQSGANSYVAVDKARRVLPTVTQVYPMDAWWQWRPWMPTRVLIMKGPGAQAGQQATEW